MMFYKVPFELIHTTEEALPFHLFIRNNHTGKKNLACAKNDTLTTERLEDIQERAQKGEEPLILDESLDEFDSVFGNKDKILEANREQIQLKELEERRVKFYAENYPEPDKILTQTLKEARENNTFLPMVEAARAQIESFSLKRSQYFSTLVSFCSFLLSREGELPSGIAFSFFLAQKLKIENQEDLLEIAVAYSLRELGYAYLKLGKDRLNDPDYEKYPMFTQHILSLAKTPFSKNISRYILEHREKHNQTGFPRGKGEQHTHYHSYIVGACHELFQIYYKAQKGKEFNNALAKAGKSSEIHPQIAATIYGFHR